MSATGSPPLTPPARTIRKTLNVPLNRVEGDLEVRVQIENSRVCNAWSAGTMYRGIENMLVGRAALDGLVITPRVCGICTTAHLLAAATALEDIAGVNPPPGAVRIRNITLGTELLQSDVRQSVLMYMVDFANSAYASQPEYGEAVARFQPFKGRAVLDVIRETKKLLEVIAILGGQWPHSSYMVPGGIVSVPSEADLAQCRHLLAGYRNWYERQVLGCGIERWREVESEADLDAWLAEKPAHAESVLGFYIRFARAIGLHRLGRGHGNYLSVGGFPIPDGSSVRGRQEEETHLIAAGFARGTDIAPFDQSHIAEHVTHSWYADYEGGRHPFDGETRPYACGEESHKYSWAKAPRYGGAPAETGPLAQMIVSRHPLFTDIVNRRGASAFVRQLARLVRGAELIPAMEMWLSETNRKGDFYQRVAGIECGQGLGAVEVTRGALGHWVRIADGRIEKYQIITPTAWNGSPRDADGVRGPWEEALLGTQVKDPTNPVDLGLIVRSFDPCLVCTVHAIDNRGGHLGRSK